MKPPLEPGPRRFPEEKTAGAAPAPPRATFRPHERLRRQRDFRRVFERRRACSDERMAVHGVENGLPYTRIGLSVSRKRVGRAARRNRVKRILREAFRLNKAAIPTGLDLVVVPKHRELSFEEANRSLPRLAQEVQARLERDRRRGRSPSPTPRGKGTAR